MQACTFDNFLHTLKPWLDSDYIRKGFIDSNGVFRIFFNDGGERTFRIDDCTETRLKEIFSMMIEKGIPVEKAD
jgi:hypothetical protein